MFGKKVLNSLKHRNIKTDIFCWYFDKLVRGGLNHLRHILITCLAAHGALENVSALKSFGQVCCLNSAFILRKKKKTIERRHVSVRKG